MLRLVPTVPLVATLAVGIGFNVVSLAVMGALLYRPFPYPALGELMLVRDARPTDGAHQSRAIAAADFFDLRSLRALLAATAFRSAEAVMTSPNSDPEQIEASAVTANFFFVLGIQPLLGRFWPPDTDEAGHDRYIIISRRLWHTRFGDDPSAIGREIGINGRAVMIVGVIRDADCYPAGVDAWTPLAMTPADRAERATQRLEAIARLAPGASIEGARHELGAVARRLEAAYPLTNHGRGFELLPLRREQYEFTAPLFGLLQAASMLVLLLAVVNVTAVLTARWLDRASEIAIRVVLGASGRDIIRLVAGESAGITGTATILGVMAGRPALIAFRASLPEGIARWVNGWAQMRVDALAVAAGVVLGLMATLAISLAVVSAARHVSGGHAAGARVTRGRVWAHRTIIVTQVGLAAALLVCAFVVFQALGQQLNVFARFAPAHLLRFTITTPPWRYVDDTQIAPLHVRVADAVQALPGVERVGFIRNEPASNVPSPVVAFQRLDRPARTPSERPHIDVQTITPSTLDVLQLTVTTGRSFMATDSADAPRVGIVGAEAVRRYWTDRDPIGTVVDLDGGSRPIRIVGVVTDAKLNWYDPGLRPTLYVPDAQAPARTMSVIVRTRVDPAALGREVRNAIATVDSLQPIGGLEPLTRSIADSLSPVRVLERMLIVAAGVAALLAGVGIFGLLAQSVAQRRQELGVRIAVGATERSIASMVLSEALLISGVGLTFGVLAAVAIVRVAGTALIGLGEVDTRIVAAVVVSTVALVVGAAILPAVRAARVDPALLLRL